MHFMHRDDWYCQFLEADCKTPLLRKVTFKTPAEVRAMIERVATMTEHQLSDFGHAIETGRGGAWLALTEEQYRKLK